MHIGLLLIHLLGLLLGVFCLWWGRQVAVKAQYRGKDHFMACLVSLLGFFTTTTALVELFKIIPLG